MPIITFESVSNCKRISDANKADGEKMFMVKSAEADAEERFLIGMGIARERNEIAISYNTIMTDYMDTFGGMVQDSVMVCTPRNKQQ